MSKNYSRNNLVILGSVGLTMLTVAAGMVLINNKVYAESLAASTASITVPAACIMQGVGMGSHTATLAPNTYSGASGSEYENGIGKTTLTAICNDDNGFSIYAIGYTGNSYDSENHTKLVGSTTGGTISTKAYASGDTTSNWSMKLTKVTDTTESYNPQNLTIQSDAEGIFSNWHSIPDTYTKVAEYHANTGSSTTDAALGVKLETTYAAYIASNQLADTYIGQVKYTMVHPYTETPLQPQIATSGCINYFPNGYNVEGAMGCQSIANTDTSVTLLTSNFSRTGYGFAGWSNKFDYATNPNQEGIDFYGPQETITFTAGEYTDSNNGLSLYAVWVKSEGSIQDTAKVSEVCNRLTTAPTDGTANLSSVSALTDQRDNQTYAIAKLADGKCWMIESTRLESTNSDNRTGALAQGYGGQFEGLANAETADEFSGTYSANSLYSNDGANNTINIGTSDVVYRMPHYDNVNTSARVSSPTDNSSAMYSYGNYYTWSAAIADTTAYTSNNTSVTGSSICPTGWRLPQGGNKTRIEVSDDNDFWNLTVDVLNGGVKPANYSSNTTPYYTGTTEAGPVDKKLRSFPNNFIYSGDVWNGSVLGRGSNGLYWSSTAASSYFAYYLYLDPSLVYPGTSNYSKYSGKAVRCVASGV